MHSYVQSEQWDEFMKEVRNQGCKAWEPLEHPDWLLLEIENNLTIRKIQSTIAQRMEIDEGSSQVMQLNMGEGKSSVIIPMVTADLANRERLVRVLVLKPLATQMFHLLVQKVGGLINRRIY